MEESKGGQGEGGGRNRERRGGKSSEVTVTEVGGVKCD